MSYAGLIRIAGKYIGTEEGITINGVYFEKGVLTEASVDIKTYNTLMQARKEGWMTLIDAVSREEILQLISNAIGGYTLDYMTDSEVKEMMNEVIKQ